MLKENSGKEVYLQFSFYIQGSLLGIYQSFEGPHSTLQPTLEPMGDSLPSEVGVFGP